MNLQLFKKYTQQGLYRSIEVFTYPNEYSPITRVLGYRFLCQHHHREPRIAPSKTQIITSIKNMVEDNITQLNTDNYSKLTELVDILIEFSPDDGKQLLNRLRTIELQANEYESTELGTEGTIYSDRQNTHNEDLHNNLHNIVEYLCKTYPVNFEGGSKEYNDAKDAIEQTLYLMTTEDEKDIIKEVVERIFNDNKRIHGYTADNVLFSLWTWISKSKDIKSLYKRLVEELLEMHRYCSSRLMQGLVNVMQGFSDDINLQIRISTEEQCKAVVYTYLNKVLTTAPEEVMDGLLTKDDIFKTYIKTKALEKLSDWRDEYGADDFNKYFPKILQGYLLP